MRANMKGSDMKRRTAKTKKAVHEAFFTLLESKRYAQITVQNILDVADISRSTFYAHYGCKEDLLAEVVDEICEHAASPTEPEARHDFTNRTDETSMVEHVLRHVRERESGVRAIMRSEGFDRFARYLRESLVRQADAAIPNEPGGAAGGIDRSFLLNHIAGSLVEVIGWWAREGFATDERTLAESYVALMRPLFQ